MHLLLDTILNGVIDDANIVNFLAVLPPELWNRDRETKKLPGHRRGGNESMPHKNAESRDSILANLPSPLYYT